MPQRIARPSRLTTVGIVAAFCALLVAALCWATPTQISGMMESVTGEEDLWHQIRGTGAWLYLRLSQPAPKTARMVPIAHSGLSPFGINTFLEQEVEEEKVAHSLQLISDAGFQWIRQQFPWEDIEIYGKGDYWDHQWDRSAWEKYDRIVDMAEEYGIEIIARLDNPPAWSREVGNAPGWSMAPPDDFEDYGDFVYAVVSRYKGRIRYYQIWNEPNIYPEWGDQPVDPEGYVELLQIAYRRAKEADPDCVIVAAGLAQTIEYASPELGPRNLSDLVYLERMYEAGVQGYFDAMGAMVYGLWTGPNDRRTSPERTNFARATLLREIMVRHGDADKPIWATEVGWNALPADFAGTPLYGRVTPEQQARYALEAYERAAREWPWMGVMNYWFFRRPSDAEREQAWYYFRMVEPDFELLPVYHAMQELMQQAPTVHIGYHQPEHWALYDDGSWETVYAEQASLGSARRGTAGAELSFRFSGTGLDLALLEMPEPAAIEIRLNGRFVTGLRPDHSPTSNVPVLRVATGLADRTHEVEIIVREGSLTLDGIVVHRESRAHRVALPMLLAAGFGVAVALFLRPRMTAT